MHLTFLNLFLLKAISCLTLLSIKFLLRFVFNMNPYVRVCSEAKGRGVFVTLVSEIKNLICHIMGFPPLTSASFADVLVFSTHLHLELCTCAYMQPD